MMECWIYLVNKSTIYRQSSQRLEVITAVEDHGRVSKLPVWDWMALHPDDDLDVSSCVVLPLHKDVLCGSDTHEVGGRQHSPAQSHRVPKSHSIGETVHQNMLFFL